MQPSDKKEDLHTLTDMDCQMFSKTYRLICELYYERKGKDTVQDLVHLTQIIPQIVESKKQANAMMILSQMEILKAKAKGEEELKTSIDKAIEHLRRPVREPLKAGLVVDLLRKNELFSTGCMIAIRLFAEIATAVYAKDMLECIGNNLMVNTALAVELLLLLCSNSEENCQLAVKEGIVKSLFLNYIPVVMKELLLLYKSIKIVKVISNAERSILRDREKVLAAVVFNYDDYIPIVSDICTKCYDGQYCSQIQQVLRLETIDQLYLWSFVQPFCKDILQQRFIDSLLERLKANNMSAEMQTKVLAIVVNYCKFCEYLKKDFFKILPKHQQSLPNYLKMCVALGRLDPNSVQLIDWPALDSLISSSSNSKVMQLHKGLKEMINRSVQVGTLDNSLKSIFSADKNADMLGERIGRIPRNNAQLEDTRHILNETSRSGASEFDRDTLQMMKEKAIQSLHTAISCSYKFNINPLINDWQNGNVELLSRFLQVVELNLMMNAEAVDGVDVEKVLQLIRWIEENYNGEVVDWGGIVEILAILFEEGEWLKHTALLPKDSFWMLQVSQLKPKSEKVLFSCIDSMKSASTKQLSMIIGFLGKTLHNQHKLKLISSHGHIFQRIREQIGKGTNYKLHLMMLSYFFKGWHAESQEESQTYKQDNSKFQSTISQFVDQVITSYRALPQQHCFLQSCLPFKIQTYSLTKNTSQLANTHGKLAAYLNANSAKAKVPQLAPDRFASLASLTPSVLLQNLKFLAENPSLVSISELQKLLDRITKNKDSFWDLYPHYLNIVSLLIQRIDASSQELTHHLTDDIVSLITEVEENNDIQADEKEDLLYDMCDTLESLKNKGSYIEIERIRKTVTKITEEKVREEIIYILDNYQIKQQPPKKPEVVIAKQNKTVPIKATQPKKQEKKVMFAEKIESELRMQANLQSFASSSVPIEVPKPVMDVSLEQQFQSVKYQSVKATTLFDALEMLKRIVDKQEHPSKFNTIYPILSASSPTQPEKVLMGTLLAKYYEMETDERALTLLLDKERTDLSKELFEGLVRKHVHAFKLVRRWRFQSREALDIAVARMKDIYLDDACVVATYNLKKSTELEYFYSRKYHLTVIEVLCRVVSEDEVVHFLTLIGTVVKLPQIKQEFIAHGIHTKIMPLNTMFPMSARVNSSLSYALSTLSFEEPIACAQIVAQAEPLSIIYACLRSDSTNKMLVEPGACLIANLSYPNAQLKETLRQRKTISLLLLLFENNLATTQSSTYKQLLRSMGNLSMSRQCTEQLIDGHFCKLAIRMAENLDFFVYYDEKKARLMKLLINLISNLANHKTKLEAMHSDKITLLIITMLETTEKNTDLLAGCIDTVDALCQSPEVELFMIGEKRLPYILMDVFKLQQEVTILLKAGRLLSNLTIHNQCIPFILKTSILSVVGNVVVPNLYVGCMSLQQAKRMEGYVLKILSRIYQCKPTIDLVLKSGYLDCLVRTIELCQVEDSHLEIFFFYSSHLPNFLNKRAFSCLIKVLIRKVDSKVMIGKCIVSFKNILTFSYNRDDEDEVIEDIPCMYEQILKSQFLVDGLFLLVYHLLRSHNLRKMLRKKIGKVTEVIQNLGKEELYLEIARSIMFLVHNPSTPLWFASISEPQEEEQFYRVLKIGFQCLLYRGDGSHKKAKLDIDEEYNIRLYKYPDGQVKAKYVLNINHVRDLQVDFREKNQLWSHTVFAIEQSFLETHVPDRKLCMTLIGSSHWGQVKLLNFEFFSEQEKMFFYQCVSHLIYLFKT